MRGRRLVRKLGCALLTIVREGVLAALTAGMWPLLVSIPRIVAPYADGMFGLNIAILTILVFLISLAVVMYTSLSRLLAPSLSLGFGSMAAAPPPPL